MSASGQKRTFAVQKGMSALPPIADMCSATRHVRFVPIADIGSSIRSPRRRAAEAIGIVEAEGFRSLQVEDKFELGRLQNRKIGRVGTF